MIQPSPRVVEKSFRSAWSDRFRRHPTFESPPSPLRSLARARAGITTDRVVRPSSSNVRETDPRTKRGWNKSPSRDRLVRSHSFIHSSTTRERERRSESEIVVVVRPASSSSSKQTSSSTRANAPFRLFGELRLVDEILARERAEVLLRRPDRHGRPSVSAGRDGTPAGRDESTGTRV